MPSAARLRTEPIEVHEGDAGQLEARQILECEDTREKLASAGYRGQAPLIAFMFFRFVMPFIVFVVALFYLFRRYCISTGRRCMKVWRRLVRRPDWLLSARHVRLQHDRSAASNRSCAPFPMRWT